MTTLNFKEIVNGLDISHAGRIKNPPSFIPPEVFVENLGSAMSKCIAWDGWPIQVHYSKLFRDYESRIGLGYGPADIPLDISQKVNDDFVWSISAGHPIYYDKDGNLIL